MATSVGTNNKIECYEHFLSFSPDTYIDTLQPLGTNGVNSYGVGALTFAATVTEPGGVLAITTDTTDNNNVALWVGPFKPADGGCWMEARFKVDAINDCAVYAGWSQTLDATTPVMPAEYATDSFIYNGTGSMAGMQYDCDATDSDWRAVAGDAGAAFTAGACDSNTTRAYQAPVAAEFDVVRVDVTPAGYSSVYLSDDNGGLRLIKAFSSAFPATDVGFMTLILENRADAAAKIEVDYFNAGASIDWTR